MAQQSRFVTADELARMPEDSVRYELVRGRVVDPERQSVTVHRAGFPETTIDLDGALEGLDVLPGFHCDVREILD